MDFELNDVQKSVQKAAREFAQKEFSKEIAMELEKNEEFPFELWRKACKLGFVGSHFPEEYGGQGLGVLEKVLIIEEFCRVDSSIGQTISMVDFPAEVILRKGSRKQKEEYLPLVAEGKAIPAMAITEPQHGSDIMVMDTKATKIGNEYLVNGTKTMISYGNIADFFVTLCQTDQDVRPTYRGQSFFIIEKENKGLDVVKIENKMGIRLSPTAEVYFNDVKVSKEHLIGEENKGFYYALEFFYATRPKIAAQALGMAQGAFDFALAYAREREQFGRRIGEFQAIQHKLAEMAIKIETARLAVYRAAWSVDQGKIDPYLGSVAKAYAGRVAVEVADEALQILGGYGYIAEHTVERIYRDAKIMEIYEGTKEIQKNTIASILQKQKSRISLSY